MDKKIDLFIVNHSSGIVEQLEEELAKLEESRVEKELAMHKAKAEMIDCSLSCIQKKHQLDAMKSLEAFYIRAFG